MAEPTRKSPAEVQREDKGEGQTPAPAAPQAKQPESAKAAAPVAEDAPKFSRAEILGNARTRYGHGKYVVAGALSTLDGDEFTDAQVTAAVEQFVGRPLDPGQPENLDEPRTDQEEGE